MVAGDVAYVEQVQLRDFRCFASLDLSLAPGVTVIVGANGAGKTSLLEAVGWIARARSFRGVTDSALVARGSEQAILRADVVHGERRQLLEAEIRATGRNRVLLNRHPIVRTRDLYGLLRVTMFAPDDLQLVKGGPAERREYLDDLLGMLAPRYDAARSDFDRVLRQRNALLKGGLRDPDDDSTLVVFDEQLVRAGAEIVRGRLRLLARLHPLIVEMYEEVSGSSAPLDGTYQAEWAEAPLHEGDADAVDNLLRQALVARRKQELDRGITLVGPHRDDWRIVLNDLDARAQASQGEQRTLALALRLAGHELITDLSGAAPVLLLDDVFSELDAPRASALIRRLPGGQTLVTTASAIPEGVEPQRFLRVAGGTVEAE
ncbi:MAG: replication and repair protein RecF [Actinomycetia bacterium]|nr:replication and repair protein RecF [Actinomycetes bacterium]